MSNIAGKTSNGYTYEGDHHPGSSGRVNWTATYRLKGEFAGIRHGLVHDMHGVFHGWRGQRGEKRYRNGVDGRGLTGFGFHPKYSRSHAEAKGLPRLRTHRQARSFTRRL